MILGIDIGTANCGLALLDDRLDAPRLTDSITVKTQAIEHEAERLRAICLALTGVHASNPGLSAAIEGYSHGSKFGLAEMGEIGGVVRYHLYMHGIPYTVWPPSSWKKTVLGNGKLDKSQIRIEVYKRYGVEIKDQNQLDAYCVAMAEFMARTGSPRPRPKKRKAPVEA